jgi:hypothetical protein
MSIVNLNVTNDHAWMCFDTMITQPGGRAATFASKGSVFPHLYTVAGFRGLISLHHKFDCWMNGGGRMCDVAEAAELLPDYLETWRWQIQDELDADEQHHVKGELFLLGWVPATKSFQGWYYNARNDFVMEHLPVPCTRINPGCADAGYQPPGLISSPMQLVKSCTIQKQMVEANLKAGGTDLCIGGEVILVELSKNGFNIRKALRFDDYQETKEAIRRGRGDRGPEADTRVAARHHRDHQRQKDAKPHPEAGDARTLRNLTEVS